MQWKRSHNTTTKNTADSRHDMIWHPKAKYWQNASDNEISKIYKLHMIVPLPDWCFRGSTSTETGRTETFNRQHSILLQTIHTVGLYQEMYTKYHKNQTRDTSFRTTWKTNPLTTVISSSGTMFKNVQCSTSRGYSEFTMKNRMLSTLLIHSTGRSSQRSVCSSNRPSSSLRPVQHATQHSTTDVKHSVGTECWSKQTKFISFSRCRNIDDQQPKPSPPRPFFGPFSGSTQVSRCQKRTSGLHGARED